MPRVRSRLSLVRQDSDFSGLPSRAAWTSRFLQSVTNELLVLARMRQTNRLVRSYLAFHGGGSLSLSLSLLSLSLARTATRWSESNEREREREGSEITTVQNNKD